MKNRKFYACCFIGHREIEITERLIVLLTSIIEDLIVNHNVREFLFGSRSQFDKLCLSIVSDMREKYPFIKRIAYICKHETCTLENEKEKWEGVYSWFEKREVKLLCVDEEKEYKNKYVYSKASYVERNKSMIDDSDFCIVYYKENYLPPKREHIQKRLGEYQPKSGTKIAYDYIKQKKKKCINVASDF